MKTHSRWLGLGVFALSLIVCQQARAASITGKVVDVTDGDEITIFNLNRNVRIKLMAIDAPEKDQAFGAAARQHLFDLVHDKLVSVEYWGVGQHNILIGRVLSGGNDICAQMIRDGAAWFDPASKDLLTETDREIYFQSEQAARSERRGLWSSGNAVAPWEFVKAEELKKSGAPTTPKAVATNEPPKQVRPTPGLDSMGLLRTGTAVAQPASLRGETNYPEGSSAGTWRRFQPSDQNFSVMVPEGGMQVKKETPVGSLTKSISEYLVREGDSVYQVFWFKSRFVGETDSVVFDSLLGSYMRAANKYIEKVGVNAQCEPSGSRNITVRGYSGREYDMTQCPFPHTLRVYTKVSDGERSVFGGMVIFNQEDENVSKFLKSFTATTLKAGASRPESTK